MQRKKLFPIFLIIVLLTNGLPTVSKASPASAGDPPIRLVLLDYIPPAMTTLAVQGNYAYVGAGPSMLVIDVSDPEHPQRVAHQFLPEIANKPVTIEKVVASGQRVYVLITDDLWPDSYYILIYDVTYPEAPFWMGTYGPLDIYDIEVQGTTLYYLAPGGLNIMDVSDPHNLKILGTLPTHGMGKFCISGKQAYLVLTKDMGIPSIFWVVDISNPFQPVKIGELEPAFGIWFTKITGMAASNDYVVLSGDADDVSIIRLYDISNPVKPVVAGAGGIYQYGKLVGPVVVNGNYLYTSDTNLTVYDISNPSAITSVTQFEDSAWSLVMVGNMLYAAEGPTGLKIYDITNPARPQIHGSLLGIGTAEDVIGQDGFLYISDGGTSVSNMSGIHFGGLAIADTHQLGQVNIAGKSIDDGSGQRLEQNGDLAYLVAKLCTNYKNYVCSSALKIVKISQPGAPTLLGIYPDVMGDSISIRNHIAYIARSLWFNDLTVLDVSNPATPTLLSQYKPPIPPYLNYGYSGVHGVVITGTYGLLTIYTEADYVKSNSLQVFDVSDPVSITELTSYPLTDPGRIFMQGALGFVVDAYQTLRFIDLSQLPQVQILSSITTPEAINDVAYDGRYAYIADGQAGLLVIDLLDPYQPHQVYAYDTIGNAVGVSVDGDWVYLADQEGGLLILRKVTPQFYLPFLTRADTP